MPYDQTTAEISVDVWFWDNADLVAQADTLVRVLSDDEIARQHRQCDPDRALRWAISRARVREHLASVTGVAAADLVFERNGYGQLSLANVQCPSLCFSISHSGPFTALAVSLSTAVGVDIEAVQDLAPEEMEWPLSPTERADLGTVRGDDRAQAFFRYWTLKEAFIKALGMGVSFPLDDFDMNPFGEKPALLRVVGTSDTPADWAFEAHELRPGLRFALAVKAKGEKFTLNHRSEFAN